MSQINTNGINTNYPEPGTNNSSQGFRDNFSQIRTNLDTASNEITDLQNKVVVKTALNGTVLNNDMANTLISNASTSGFRATTYNLGNALSGTVLVDVNRADVQYGAVTGNLTLQFGGWAPTNTESNVVLRLTVANVDAVISLPNAAVSANNNFGVTILENYQDVNGTATLTAPANVGIIEYTFSTLDCGNTISVSPNNRPFQSTQIVTRKVPSTGVPGDVNGDIAVGPSLSQIEISSTNAADYLITGSTSQLYPDLPVIFTGTSMEANIVTGSTYYVRNVVSTTQFTVATSVGGGNVNLTGNASPTAAMYGNPTSYLYISTGNYNSSVEIKTLIESNATGNVLTLNGTNNLVVNAPIIFTGNVDTANTNLVANNIYYIKTISSPNVTISQSKINGIAGTVFVPGTKANLDGVATIYVGGNDIWKQIPLLPDVDTTSNIAAANVIISNNLTVGGNVTINGNLDVNGSVIDTLNANNITTINFTSSGTFSANTFSANTLSGNINAINLDVSGIANIPTVDDIRIGGGLNGYYLVTDGTGNLSWVSGGGSGNGTVAGSNTQIQFNNAGSFGAAAGLTFDSVTNIFSAPGNIVATGNASGGNLTTSGVLSVTGNANVGNLGTSGLIVATGNVTGGNLVTSGALSVTGNANVGNIGGTTGVFTSVAGVLTTAAQPNITSVGTLTSLGVSGNTTSNNISSNNYVIVSANSSITAAGTTQGTATQLASSINVVTTVPASSGVKLPTAEAGMRIIVRNSTSTALNVYPNTGAAIEPALANAPYTLNATTSMEFFCSTGGGSGQWFTLF
jgi:hypothetical protein